VKKLPELIYIFAIKQTKHMVCNKKLDIVQLFLVASKRRETVKYLLYCTVRVCKFYPAVLN